MTGENIKKRFLDIKDLAEFFNISRTTAYRLIEGRRIPFYKIGHSIRFKMEDIEKYLEEVKIEPIDHKRY